MRQTKVVITRYGGPEVITVAEQECPAPMPGEVRLRSSLRAQQSAVNSVDFDWAQEAWHQPSQAQRGFASKLRRLFPAYRCTLGSGGGGLLPRNLHWLGVGRAAPQ